MEIIKYKIENFTNEKQYVFDFIFFILGVKGELVPIESLENYQIYYGKKQFARSNIIHLNENWGANPIWNDLIDKKNSKLIDSKTIDFDIINAIWRLISDEVNEHQAEQSFDNFDRLKMKESFQFKSNIHHFPIINLYIQFLSSIFKQRFGIVGKPLLPAPYKCAIGLSHDVDFPDRFATRYSPFWIKGSGFKKHLTLYFKKISATVRRPFDSNPDNHWLFEQIMESEKKYGFQSGFYFASVNKFYPYSVDYDVNYNIDNFRFINIMNQIVKNGFEVGLHASFNAYQSAERFVYEKQKIEKHLHLKIKGLRHHGWHLSKDVEKTLLFHEKAGFDYDTSISFNDELGFRRNVALPYFPWNTSEQRKLNVLQLPTFCMDGHLFYKPIEADDAVQKIIEYIQKIKQYEGIGIIDWHVRTSFPTKNNYTKWGKAYQEVLKYLSHDNEIWVTSCEKLSDWFLQKRQ